MDDRGLKFLQTVILFLPSKYEEYFKQKRRGPFRNGQDVDNFSRTINLLFLPSNFHTFKFLANENVSRVEREVGGKKRDKGVIIFILYILHS